MTNSTETSSTQTINKRGKEIHASRARTESKPMEWKSFPSFNFVVVLSGEWKPFRSWSLLLMLLLLLFLVSARDREKTQQQRKRYIHSSITNACWSTSWSECGNEYSYHTASVNWIKIVRMTIRFEKFVSLFHFRALSLSLTLTLAIIWALKFAIGW